MNIFKTAIAAALLTSAPSLAQDDVQIKVQKLSDTLSVLFGKGGNIGVSAGDDGVFIIDDQYAVMSDKIRAAVSGLSDKPIKYVINTHWHGDHTGGNESFGKTNSVIIAHDNIRKRMASGSTIMPGNRVVPPAPKAALPVITFNDSLSLHINGEEARLFHVKSAHTDGDGIIAFKSSNIIHMGDTFFFGMFPFIDHNSGGSLKGTVAAAELVLKMVDDKTQIIPGHGPVTDKAGLVAYKDMLVTMFGKISALKESGMSLDEVIAANPTADVKEKWDTWGDGWKNRFVTALYNEAE